MTPSLPDAVAAIGDEVTADAARQLLDAFMAATIYSPAPPKPGVVALDFAGMQVVPVFTSEHMLAAFTGPCDWFSTTGLDLLGLLPEGVHIALDPNGPHPLLLDPAATTLEYAVIVRVPGPPPTDDEA